MYYQDHLSSYDLYFPRESDCQEWFRWFQRLMLRETIPRDHSLSPLISRFFLLVLRSSS